VTKVDCYLDDLLDARAKDLECRMTPWAFHEYPKVIKDVIKGTKASSALEVGGGRFPLLSQEEARDLNVAYTSNDISQRELDLAPDWVGCAKFDIQTPDEAEIEQFEGRYDVVFSNMVMEHVASYERAYRNMSRLLKPGGVAIAFNPTLFTFPFLVNRLMPDGLSSAILSSLFYSSEIRKLSQGHPKFPAYYSGCVISGRVKNRIKALGFRRVHQLAFYGHGYYEKMPVLRDVHKVMSEVCAKADINILSAYSYTFAVK
jgi:SAM-dependent methyltransferase